MELGDQGQNVMACVQCVSLTGACEGKCSTTETESGNFERCGLVEDN